VSADPERRDETARRRKSHDATLDRYIGDSTVAEAVRDKLRVIAASDASVLILGASGTGKELAATIIHGLSARAGGTFVAIDGGALAEGVVESELFGHARGAYTGALTERRGLFEEADGGTLFLDEVGNAPLGIQARLLRVLESREVRRLGDNRTRTVDVRVLAATNRDLEAEVRASRFREDLFYRLDVVRLELPSLRDRREDIPVIAQHLATEASARVCQTTGLTPAAEEVLTAYDWPGNVRELRNVIESAAVLAAGRPIEPWHLPERLQGKRVSAQAPTSRQSVLADRERRLVLERLKAVDWNVTRAARALGMSRQGLYSRLHALGLWAEFKERGR
jgi:DNA-binding NtrC family response regulator